MGATDRVLSLEVKDEREVVDKDEREGGTEGGERGSDRGLREGARAFLRGREVVVETSFPFRFWGRSPPPLSSLLDSASSVHSSPPAREEEEGRGGGALPGTIFSTSRWIDCCSFAIFSPFVLFFESFSCKDGRSGRPLSPKSNSSTLKVVSFLMSLSTTTEDDTNG